MSTEILIESINSALDLLNEKYARSSEKIIEVFIERYSAALESLQKEVFDRDCLTRLKHCTRMYLEASSNYEQEFFKQMELVEKLLKEYL